MKIKEIDRTANVCWSPMEVCPIYLATGTAAQQLDASFNTTSLLEIYEFNFQEPGLEMACKGSIPTDNRCHKMVWGGFGLNISEATNGVIVTGCDGGSIVLYDPNKVISGEGDAVIFQRDKHSGSVRGLDFNPFQTNLLASGASDSEIFIWDLNNPNSPMTPGAKSQPTDDVTCISWNRQVQHILASTFATRCVVWDLRKNEPIIKVSGSTARMRCKVIAWHPEVATQLCLASEDDHTPFIQLWDLRFATSPLKTMENHQRGVLSLAWCPQDPDMLLSCGKDNHIVCWNPNTSDMNGEVVCEIPTSNQWSFDVAWCPRNPTLISNCSFDGHVSIYSIMGGCSQTQPSSKVAEAFLGNFNSYNPPEVCPTVTEPTIILRKAPKWLKRPVGASFGFGGKLITFEYEHQGGVSNTQVTKQPPRVLISQVVTDPRFINRACELEKIIEEQQFSAFCDMKLSRSNSSNSQQIWKFLQANFESNPTSKFLSLLGYTSANPALVSQLSNSDEFSGIQGNITPVAVPDGFGEFERIEDSGGREVIIPTDDGIEGSITRLLLRGDLDNAVELCLRENRIVEAILLGIVGGNKLLAHAQEAYFKKNMDSSLTRLIASVVTKKWNRLFESCSLESWKEALAGALVYADAENVSILCESLGQRLENESNDDSYLQAMLCYICAGNISKFVSCWSRCNASSEPSVIQDLVEQVTILQQAHRITQHESDNIPIWTETLCHYSEFLVSQGKLSTALRHLQSLSDNEKAVQSLRDRIIHGLRPASRTSTEWSANQSSRPVTSTPSTMPSYPMSSVAPLTAPKLPQQQRDMYSSQMRNSNEPFSQPNFYPTSTPAVVSSAQPLSRGHLAQRYPTQPPAFPQHNQPSYAMPHSQPAAYNPMLQPTNSPSYQSYDQQHPYSPTLQQPPLPEFQNPAPMHPSMSQYPADMTPGWNDPPSLVKPEHESKHNYDLPAPITHPLFGAQEVEVNYPRPGDATAFMENPNDTSSSMPNDFQRPSMHPSDGVAPYSNMAHQQPSAYQEPPLKVKGPIPNEHQVLHDIFDDLRNRCYMMTTNMQIKRKLDDVAKKLEILDDALRENKLSPNTLLGLHQIVQALQQNDFLTALHTHTLIVGKAAFSEISGFMPGLKALLQTASQLSVNFRN